jgi:60 kDa SS-A/Ro ribonucleoprotein
MAKNYVKKANVGLNATTPQMERAREDQVVNNAGGYVFKLDDWKILDRFLILGTEGGTYYVSEKKLSKDSAKLIGELIKKDGKRVTDRTIEVSQNGLAFKQDPTIFVMAMLSTAEDKNTRRYAMDNLHKVLRIGTFLLSYTAYVTQLRGWGRGLRNAISNWYNKMSAEKLAVQVTKYQSRSLEGELPWSHRDLLRLAHVRPVDTNHNLIYQYVTHGVGNEKGQIKPVDFADFADNESLEYIWAHETAKKLNGEQLVSLINQYHLTHESIPTELQTKEIWNELVKTMPMTATIRNLGRMTSMGVLAPLSSNVQLVCERITDDEVIRKSRIHPMSILMALRTYSEGHGFRGKLTWSPIQKIVTALDTAFYKAFKNVEPTGKRILLGVDCSGSMSYPIPGLDCLSSRDVAATIAMAIMKKETNSHVMGFCHNFVELKIDPEMRLDNVLEVMDRHDWGSTDCALPMLWATKNKVQVDAFVILTDNETWSNSQIQPFEALNQYRRKFTKDAKLIVLGTTATEFTIGDPNDLGTLNIAGCSSDVPQVVSKFIAGKI